MSVQNKSDERLLTDMLNELKWDTTVDETEVGVQVHNGIVTLTGSIGSYAKKMAARAAAHRVYGVRDVVDNMEVKVPSRWERSDEDIARAVRSALTWDVLVPDEAITSTVSSGVVTLLGTVDTQAARSNAERAVQRLTGVRNVVNRITISTKTLDQAELKRQIEAALERQAEREARRIGVIVEGGSVTLTGSVRSWAEKNAIERAVAFAPGVRLLEDRTIVDPYH
jgi:osmotically-inducible protein OsmY